MAGLKSALHIIKPVKEFSSSMDERSHCIFCQIADGKKSADIVYQNEHVVAFRDIHPKAPVHVVIIPRIHIAALTGITPQHTELMGRMMLAINEVAQCEGIFQSGYRVVINTGRDGHQEIMHLHIHVLGGRQF